MTVKESYSIFRHDTEIIVQMSALLTAEGTALTLVSSSVSSAAEKLVPPTATSGSSAVVALPGRPGCCDIDHACLLFLQRDQTLFVQCLPQLEISTFGLYFQYYARRYNMILLVSSDSIYVEPHDTKRMVLKVFLGKPVKVVDKYGEKGKERIRVIPYLGESGLQRSRGDWETR